ncbi:MAG: hypothetical protein IPK16_04510 [Anaerolineales bacterium]|nr:hypothetical protein [Anaerolineales bacterium]
MSELPPMDGHWHGWSQSVQIDLPALRAYAQAVYANSDEFVAGLSDADLGNEVDLSAIGFGRQSLGMLLSVLVSNVHWHTGEISCLKGIQGYQGYPF